MKLMNASFEPARTPFDGLAATWRKSMPSSPIRSAFRRSIPVRCSPVRDAFPRLADPRELRRVRENLPIYIFSGSDDPVGQRLEGVRVLLDRYHSAGIASLVHDFYSGGRHEMLHELNRREVITNLLVWIAGILQRAS